MTNEQLNAVKGSVKDAFAQMSGTEIRELVKEPYAEFRQQTAATCLIAA